MNHKHVVSAGVYFVHEYIAHIKSHSVILLCVIQMSEKDRLKMAAIAIAIKYSICIHCMFFLDRQLFFFLIKSIYCF